jgi:hypothetical protein
MMKLSIRLEVSLYQLAVLAKAIAVIWSLFGH